MKDKIVVRARILAKQWVLLGPQEQEWSLQKVETRPAARGIWRSNSMEGQNQGVPGKR